MKFNIKVNIGTAFWIGVLILIVLSVGEPDLFDLLSKIAAVQWAEVL